VLNKGTTVSELKLTHFNDAGQAHMVDISAKVDTKRIAVAMGAIQMSAEAYEILVSGHSKKGDVLGIARIAAIQGSKHTSLLIPLCHPLSLSHVNIEFELVNAAHTVNVIATTETTGKTGVEMEALTAVSTGLLTIYDMMKAVDKGMIIKEIRLLSKKGGKSGDWSPKS
jgi:cyclic pyranopterin phosphate synthase